MILFILFQFCCGECQKLMLDSRYDKRKQLELKQFDEQFSIWFTFQQSFKKFNPIIMTLKNEDYLLLAIEIQAINLILIYDQDQQIEINLSSLVIRGQWFHLIIKQNKNFEDKEFFIQFIWPFSKQYGINTKKMSKPNNESIISVNQNLEQFCLIYDTVSDEIQPITQSTKLQQLITPIQFQLLLYQVDSYFEIFFIKYSNKFDRWDMMEILINSQYHLRVYEQSNHLTINSYDGSKFQFDIQLQSWFRIFVQFFQKSILCEYQSADLKQTQSIQSYLSDHLFYVIELNFEQINFRIIEFNEQTFVKRVQNFDLINYQSQNYCKIGIGNYIDQESNTCQEYMKNEQINSIQKQIDNKYTYIQQDDFFVEQLGKIIIKQLFTNCLNQFNVPTLEFYKNQIGNIIKEPFLLWRSEQQVFCFQYYFGYQCKTYIKDCIVAKNQYCQYCDYGYVLIQQYCIKCPKNCLICEFKKQKIQCLLPKQNHFINHKNQVNFCICQNCNVQGQCIQQQDILNEIYQCFNQQQCILSEFRQLGTEFDFLYQYDYIFQFFFYLGYLEIQYYGETEFNFIILQNYRLYGISILNNQQLLNYYYTIQIIKHYQNLDKQGFFISDFYYYELTKYNLECVKKIMRSNNFGCKDYVYKQNYKCDNPPCIYQLEIRNITYYIGNEVYLEYNNFQYESINDLFYSIKEVGIEFQELYLEINFLFQHVKKKDFELTLKLKNHIQPNLNSEIYMNLQFFFNFEKKPQNQQIILKLDIQADTILIENQIINFNLDLNLTVTNCSIFNLTISDQGDFKLSASNGNEFLFQYVQVFGLFQLKLQYQRKVYIQAFQSVQGSDIHFILEHINSILILQSQIHKSLLISSVGTIYFNKVLIYFDEIMEENLLLFKNNKNIVLKSLSIFGKNAKYSLIMRIDGAQWTKIENFYGFVKEIIHSHFFLIQSNALFLSELDQKFEQIFNTTIIYVVSFELTIAQIQIELQQQQFCSVMYARISTLTIDKFQIRQIKFIDQRIINYNQGYLINLLIDGSAKINNLQIEGLQLNNFDLLQISSRQVIQIFDLQLINIILHHCIDNKFIVFKNQESESNLIILGLLFYNIQIEQEITTHLSLIEVQNYAFASFKKIILKDIQSLNLFSIIGYIFQIDCQMIHFNGINITDCKGIDFMFIQSNQCVINNLIYRQNKQQVLFKFLGKNKQIQIANSTISLDQQNLFLYIKTQSNVKLLIKDIQIIIKRNNNYFIIEGDGIRLSLQNININKLASNFLQSDLNMKFIEMQFGYLLVENLVAKQLDQQLFYLHHLAKIEIINVLLSNINSINQSFLIFITDSPLIIKNILITSMEFSKGIFYINIDPSLFQLKDIKIKNIKNVGYLFLFEQQNIKKKFRLNDIIINGVLGGELFCFQLLQKQAVSSQQLISIKH